MARFAFYKIRAIDSLSRSEIFGRRSNCRRSFVVAAGLAAVIQTLGALAGESDAGHTTPIFLPAVRDLERLEDIARARVTQDGFGFTARLLHGGDCRTFRGRIARPLYLWIRYQLRTRILERAIRKRRGVRMTSEKSSAKIETGSAGRAVPAAARPAGAIGARAAMALGQGFTRSA